MPIKIQSDLPARTVLENENIFVMTENRAASAAALILFAIILVVTLINLQVSKKRVHY